MAKPQPGWLALLNWRRGAPVGEPPDPAPASDPAEDIVDHAEAFKTLRVGDVMTPRADIVAVEISCPFNDLLARFLEAEHSRMPIYRETLDDPVGQVHVKDVFKMLANAKLRPAADEPVLRRLRREVLYVPGSMRAADLLLKMQASRIHMAMVIDEYGGADGLVTLEDLIEAVARSARSTTKAATRWPHGDHGWWAWAAMSGKPPAARRWKIWRRRLGFRVASAPADLDEDVDTVAGLVSALAGRVPQRGEVIEHPNGFDFEILDADPRRVKQVRVRKVERVVEGADSPSENE